MMMMMMMMIIINLSSGLRPEPYIDVISVLATIVYWCGALLD